MTCVDIQEIDPVFSSTPSENRPGHTKKLEVITFGYDGEDVLVCLGGVEAIEP